MVSPKITNLGYSNLWADMSTILGYASNFDQQIQKLFANGEQGFFYDPNDLSTMYQDAAGTVPVTAVGQPVGLILDKSKGLICKPIAMRNSGFDLDLSGWVTGPTLTTTWSNGQARIVGTGAIESVVNTLRSSESGPANKLYKISFDATWVSGGYLQAGSPYREGLRVLPTENAGIKKRYTYQLALHPIGPYNISCFAAESGAVWLIDNVLIEEITGNHAYQTTSASRPILRQNAVTGANYLEFDGSDDFLRTSNIDFTVTDKVSLFVGQKTNVPSNLGSLVETGSNYGNPTGGFGLFAPSGSTTVGSVPTVSGGISGGGGIFNFGTILTNNFTSTVSLRTDLSKALKTDQVRIRVNGESKIPNASSSIVVGSKFSNAPMYIGRRGSSQLPFNGHIYGIIGIGKLTSDNETAAIEKELAKRTGVTLNV